MLSVLVVEDDTLLASAYKIKLTHSGYKVHIANDGQMAIDSLQKIKPDVILLDIRMPVKDGYQTLKEIKESEVYKDIPVIISSNSGTKENIDRCLELGAVDYIVKSDISIDGLVEKINNLLKKDKR